MSEAGLKDPTLPFNRSTTFYAGHAQQKHNAAQAEYDRSAALDPSPKPLKFSSAAS